MRGGEPESTPHVSHLSRPFISCGLDFLADPTFTGTQTVVDALAGPAYYDERHSEDVAAPRAAVAIGEAHHGGYRGESRSGKGQESQRHW